MEFFIAWYSGNSYEKFAFWNRIFGPIGGTGGLACSSVIVCRLSFFGSRGAGGMCLLFSSSACV